MFGRCGLNNVLPARSHSEVIISRECKKCNRKKNTCISEDKAGEGFDRTDTHNAGSINEGLFVRPISRVGTPKSSTPSIFANSLVETNRSWLEFQNEKMAKREGEAHWFTTESLATPASP